MPTPDQLQQTITDLIDAERGILAADESTGTITKRFQAIGVESTEESRRWDRSMLLSTPDVGNYISGVIFYEETLGQSDDQGNSLPQLAINNGILPGIKVDKGTGPLCGARGDMITHGLDGLAERLRRYKKQGARFAKWREVYPISDHNPTALGLSANAEMLARYAAVCQAEGIVPIVEPEVLIDGDHDMSRAAQVNEQVWHAVFHALHQHKVILEHMILKPSIVTPGKSAAKASPEQVAEMTLRILRRTVPAAVPSINFLSEGQTPEQASANLNALNQLKANARWNLSFSYGRALQETALKASPGDPRNLEQAQASFLKRARLNSWAQRGDYSTDQE
jgi:fructose-bisphosphate aldolase, class I